MQLRSGLILSAPTPATVPPLVYKQPCFYSKPYFYSVLNLEHNVDMWPSENQACKLATKSTDHVFFMTHIRWILSFAYTKDSNDPEERRVNRLVALTIAQSIKNVSHDYKMRETWRKLSQMVLLKLDNCESSYSHVTKQYLDNLKQFMSMK
jgi:hypothetical protein